MITLKEWMDSVKYKITDGSSYGWNCYGANAHSIDSWNGHNSDGGFSFTIIIDTVTDAVYEVTACDYARNRAYRIINPDFKLAHDVEAKSRSVSTNQAWDDVEFVDLELDEDFLTKAQAIQSGEDYDTKVSVTVDFTDAELLKYMKHAHELDITFNQFIERAMQAFLDQYDQK